MIIAYDLALCLLLLYATHTYKHVWQDYSFPSTACYEERGRPAPTGSFFCFFVLCLFLSHSWMHLHFVSHFISVHKVVSGCLFVTFTAWLFRLKASSNPVLSLNYWWISSLSPASDCQRRRNATAEKGFTRILDWFWLQHCQSPVSCVNSVYLSIYIYYFYFAAVLKASLKPLTYFKHLRR